MQANWATVYREGCIASEAREIVSPFWIVSESGSEAESVLQSVYDYLSDRACIAWEFCEVVNGSKYTGEIDESDIPF